MDSRAPWTWDVLLLARPSPPPTHLGVQSLDTPVHHLRKAFNKLQVYEARAAEGLTSVVRHIRHGQAGLLQGLGSSSSGKNLHETSSSHTYKHAAPALQRP
eukprot:763612-Hanusia_phi.AAC.16